MLFRSGRDVYVSIDYQSPDGDVFMTDLETGKVAGAYMLGLPFSAGAFFAGLMAAGAIGFLNRHTRRSPM